MLVCDICSSNDRVASLDFKTSPEESVQADLCLSCKFLICNHALETLVNTLMINKSNLNAVMLRKVEELKNAN